MAPTGIRNVLPIAGMTCKACEVRVSKALRQLPGVTSVAVSASRGQAIVYASGPLDQQMLAEAVAKAGYELKAQARPWLSRDRLVWRDVVLAGLAVGLIAVLIWRFDLGRIGDQLADFATSGNLLLVALLGVAASLSTCMALVGGIVLGLSARYAELHPQATPAGRLWPQLMFNIGRIVGFTALGALIGAVGSVVTLKGWGLAIVILAVSLVMGLLGIKLTGVSPRLAAQTFTLPSSWTARLQRDGDDKAAYRDRDALILGVASFFLPCGFTQAVQVYALATGSPLQAAAIMGLFAVGTAPGLLGAGALTALVRGKRAASFFHVVGVVVITFALVNLTGALRLLGFSDSATPVVATERSANVQDVGGIQQIHTEVGPSGYSPRDAVIYADTPSTWVLEVTGLGCASFIAAPELGLTDYLQLSKGETRQVDLPPLPAGHYSYSCAMGMYTGTITALKV